jgi:hypothetical protein
MTVNTVDNSVSVGERTGGVPKGSGCGQWGIMWGVCRRVVLRVIMISSYVTWRVVIVIDI